MEYQLSSRGKVINEPPTATRNVPPTVTRSRSKERDATESSVHHIIPDWKSLTSPLFEVFLNGRKRLHCWTMQNLSLHREARSVAGTIPTGFCLVKGHGAA